MINEINGINPNEILNAILKSSNPQILKLTNDV